MFFSVYTVTKLKEIIVETGRVVVQRKFQQEYTRKQTEGTHTQTQTHTQDTKHIAF